MKPAAEPYTDPPWLAVARAELGVKETSGSAATTRILQYFSATKLVPAMGDETPWCAAFVGWCLERAGVPGTGKANARSYLDWGGPLMKPRPGCIVVFSRGGNQAQGHVGFALREMAGRIDVLGGNQGDAVSIQRYPRDRLLGWRWPVGVP